MYVLISLLVLALFVGALVDIIMRDQSHVKHLPKAGLDPHRDPDAARRLDPVVRNRPGVHQTDRWSIGGVSAIRVAAR